MTLAVAVAAAWTASAQAATAPSAPSLASAQYASPAVLQWTPGADLLNVSQTVYRAPGACTDPPAASIPVHTYDDNTTAQHFAVPGDGTWCFSISASDVAGGTASGPGLAVTIDTTPPTATVAVSNQAPGGVVQGTVRVSGTSSDAVSGVAASTLRVGPVGACPTGTTVRGSWNTTSYTDGSYDVCNTVTDRAGYTTTATLTVTVANAAPIPVPVPVIENPPVIIGPALAPASNAPIIAAPNAPAGDKGAPGAPTKLAVLQPRSRKRTRSIPLTLRWVNPAVQDLARVVVILNLKHAPRSTGDGSVVYSGLGTSAAFTLRPGKSGYVALYAYDRSGNVSRPARHTVSLAGLIPLRPLTGSRVTAPPLLSWTAKSGTAYYNVQIFRNGKRIVVGWPSAASYRMPAKLLESGIYTWFVWPAIRHGSAPPTFGDLIGRATFVYQG
ncbi:MAG TPA: hypothetical protein VFD90_13895 [Gaiellales bacterium]|nr:hypothetical protein [Gaiellales bacterium]